MWAGRLEVGRIGESHAAVFIKRMGYKILERNYKTPLGELDIVARDGGCVVFIEVKTRASPSFGPPHLSITWKKERKIIQSALLYLKREELADSAWRIDVVSVRLADSRKVKTIELFKNAVCGDLLI